MAARANLACCSFCLVVEGAMRKGGLAHYGFACSLREYNLASEFSAGAFDDYVVFCCCHFYMNFELLIFVFGRVRVRYVFGGLMFNT